MLFGIVLLVILNLISGAFAATEIALSSINKTELKISAELGEQKAKKILAALENPTTFFATTQIYITFIAFFSGAYAANTFTEPLVGWALTWDIAISRGVAETAVFIVVTVSLTYFNLVFGELVPKHMALCNPMVFAYTTINHLSRFSIVVLPFVKVLSFSANLILKLIGGKSEKHESGITKITKADIHTLLNITIKDRNIKECEILKNVLEFEHKVAKDVCINWGNTMALPLDVSLDEVIKNLDSEKHSCMPIYGENIDDITGVLNVNDIVKYIVSGANFSEFNIKLFLHNPYYIHPSKKVDELLREMNEKRICMAIVIDDNRMIVGTIEKENLIKEILGENKTQTD
jgi:Hemolysins and related proteins containing CBS domains